MTGSYLHIVCLDVPWPPDYGGAIDMFYKIKYLPEQGIKIILHCFGYGRGQSEILDTYCEKVYYYKRSMPSSLALPYIVSSRKNPLLIQRLLADDYPVLFEGIHCTYYLYNGLLKRKQVWVRLHNVEYDYYRTLAGTTHNLFKKTYYFMESRLLKFYEKRLAPSARFITISQKDERTYRQLHAQEVRYIPAFIGFTNVISRRGSGNYCLYHGNLSVPENEEVAVFLIKRVFSDTSLPMHIVIAGRRPSTRLMNMCSTAGIRLIADPSQKELDQLLGDAHIHILPSMNETGVKIKLLNALFKGRFVITNSSAVADSHLEDVCTIADKPEGYIREIKILSGKVFTNEEITKRETILLQNFNPQKNAARLANIIFNQSK